jgi:hypothetical protein
MPWTDSTARPLARRLLATLACLAVLVTATACRGRAETGFSLERAAKHIRMLGTAFGSRPTGSQADRQARDYIAAQLREAGFEVRLQDAVSDTSSGLSVPVVNIIATRPGRQREAIALVSHHDSRPESRGAADDGLGVAVCLEAGRVLAARPDPRYSLLVAITDGEELGLMGARVLKQTPEFGAVRAFLNFEAVGTTGPARLFQAGPGNGWLAAAWAAAAPFPAGSSLYTEIYRRLPNDTDFSILKQTGVPGLDFAPTGNTFAYHTRLDAPAHLEPTTLEHLGENAVRLVEHLDSVDIGARTTDNGTFFDVAGLTAFAYSSNRTLILAVIAFVLGLLATYKAFLAAHEQIGTARVIITAVWSLTGVGVVFGAMWLGCALLCSGTGLQQPWYGQAGVFLLFLATVSLAALWLFALAGRSLPVMLGPCGLPSCVWMLTLPLWAVLLAVLQRSAPGTGYLFAWPLLTASILVLALPVRDVAVGRAIGVAVAIVAGPLWLPLVWPLLEFMVGLLGSLPVVAPSWIFPALFVAAMSTVGPCLAALLLEPESRWLPSSAVTSVLVLAVVALSWVIAVEPAYTPDRPERRGLRFMEDLVQRQSWWEADTHERDLSPAGSHESAPRGWEPIGSTAAAFKVLRPMGGAFHYRAAAAALVAPPLDVQCTAQPVDGTADVDVDTTVVPGLEGTGVAFVLPAGVTPEQASLRGVVRDGQWRATMMPVPASGFTLRLRVSRDLLQKWSEARVLAMVHGVPGGVGWQRLPAWLPQDTFVWSPQSDFILAWPSPALPAPATTPEQE